MTEKSSKEEKFPVHSIPASFFGHSETYGPKEEDLQAPHSNIFDFEECPDPPHLPTHWSVVWSDLMMTMFILFVVMFIYLSFNKDFLDRDARGSGVGMNAGAGDLNLGGSGKEKEDISAGKNAMTKIFDISKHTLRNEVEDSFASVELAEDKTIRIILTGDLLFDLGKAELRDPAKELLAKIGTLLKRNPYMINISGHTDNLPIQTPEFPSNWELSLIRASKVARFLMNEVGIPQKRFYVTGHASNKPVKPNNNPRNRSFNRRVELIITKEIPEPYQDAF